ncbi:MAG: sigma-70 family RNA polymerase sigma factor [Planctomycetes bacterium]|nr:sigma-70 family RNA polymerase sigma factor [Planctomycetota bacterium]
MATASEGQDLKLMSAIKRGDTEAFEQLFYKYYRRLYSLFYRLCWDDGRAEDLLQETFIRVWRGALTFKDDLKVSSWIYRIGRNCWIDLEARRKSARRAVDIESDSMLDSGRVDALSESDPRATTSGRYAAVRPLALIDQLANPEGKDDTPGDVAARREAEDAVRSGLLDLDPMHRLVLVMSFYQGMTYNEISDALEVPLGTVKSRVFYAERKMRERLKRFMPGKKASDRKAAASDA